MDWRRLIPARAGKTPLEHWNHAWGRAHPRACGENAMTSPSPDSLPGSSPRVRGKRAHYNVDVNGTGLIPARAGKTSWMETPLPQRRAHPRACGENLTWCSSTWGTGGSSPRVRGKLTVARPPGAAQGLIPARAGKTRRRSQGPGGRRAHPRACGENAQVYNDILPGGGSSPRVRGKRGRRQGHRRPGGLIPARAGKTSRRSAGTWRRRAHPRACGENGVDLGLFGYHARLIPARAGKTS